MLLGLIELTTMRRCSLLPVLLLGAGLAASGAQAATPPQQPEQGPGGRDYKIAAVAKRAIGTAGSGTYVFHGTETPAAPRPVAVFFHSWGGVNPALYGGFIDHLARKGYLVLFPRFQEVNRSRPADASGLAETLLRDALAALAEDPVARPDLKRVAFIGHSAGVPIALNVAAGAGAAAADASDRAAATDGTVALVTPRLAKYSCSLATARSPRLRTASGVVPRVIARTSSSWFCR